MSHHELKCWPEYFSETKRGRKPFEIRENDRDFKHGDTVVLKEWDPTLGKLSHCPLGYTGELHGPFTIEYLVRLPSIFNLESLPGGVLGLVVFGIPPLEITERERAIQEECDEAVLRQIGKVLECKIKIEALEKKLTHRKRSFWKFWESCHHYWVESRCIECGTPKSSRVQ